MKLRIKDNAIRFRLTLKEVESLSKNGRLEMETWIPPTDGEKLQIIRYAIVVDAGLAESRVRVEPFAWIAELSQPDFETLASPDLEGVYIRREWESKPGQTKRFMFFVEKDRPGSSCLKPEEWIYEERFGERPITQPIPGRKS